MNENERIQRTLKLVRITALAWGIGDKALARLEARLLSRSCRSRLARTVLAPWHSPQRAAREIPFDLCVTHRSSLKSRQHSGDRNGHGHHIEAARCALPRA